MEQRLAGPKLKVWQGCLLVVLVAVFLFAAQFVLTFLQYALTYFRILDAQVAYTIASVAYWLFGGFLGLRFLRDYVLNFLYEAADYYSDQTMRDAVLKTDYFSSRDFYGGHDGIRYIEKVS